MHSGIYYGWLRHRRFIPCNHSFQYRVFMMYLDLAELNNVLAVSRCWSKHSWRPARFVRSDFLGDPEQSLDLAVRRRIEQQTGIWHQGPIRLLANLRYFGINKNPIACYYCFDGDERLQFVVAEVNNTPWDERHSYVLRCDPEARIQRIGFNKEMHVSPFNPMDMTYHWRSNKPSHRLSLHIETWQASEKQLDATLSLKRKEVNSASLNAVLWQYPWMTVKVVGAIYWQAIRLWWKKVPFYGHPGTRSSEQTL